MKQLILSEWQRLWARKTTWISFMVIPAVLIAFIRNYVKIDALFAPDNIRYVSFLNFPSRVLSEECLLIFDIIMVVLIIMAVTSEYREGQLRMVMIRSYSFNEIFTAKYIVMLATSFLLLLINFIFSYILGYFALPKEGGKIAYYSRKFTLSESMIYNLKYYIISFLVLAAFTSIIMCVAMICKTIMGALAVSIFIIFTSFILPELSHIFMDNASKVYMFTNYTFITRIQYGGIDNILAERPDGVGLMVISIIFHIIVFYSIAHSLFVDNENNFC